MKAKTVSEIIREARFPRNQKDFGDRLGIPQALISKYENEKANPPMNVVNKCLKIIRDRDSSSGSFDALSDRLKKLDGPAYIHVRNLIESMLDAAKV